MIADDIGVADQEDGVEESAFDRLLMKLAIPGMAMLILTGSFWAFLHLGDPPTSREEGARASLRLAK